MIDLLLSALVFYGLREVKGVKNNPEILNFFHAIGHKWVRNDETAWCSAFINYLALKCGYERSNELNARSWLDYGKDISNPQAGHLVILWREDPDSWKGHVGIYINHDDDFVYCLGGNQSNSVNIAAYPINQVLAYKQLKRI